MTLLALETFVAFQLIVESIDEVCGVLCTIATTFDVIVERGIA